jgi:hypothetical protein
MVLQPAAAIAMSARAIAFFMLFLFSSGLFEFDSAA